MSHDIVIRVPANDPLQPQPIVVRRCAIYARVASVRIAIAADMRFGSIAQCVELLDQCGHGVGIQEALKNVASYDSLVFVNLQLLLAIEDITQRNAVTLPFATGTCDRKFVSDSLSDHLPLELTKRS